MVASAYGLTPEQFLSYTPKQLQMITKILRIKLHNERALKVQLAGGEADFIDNEVEDMLEDIARQHDEDANSRNRDKMVKEELEKAKNGKP